MVDGLCCQNRWTIWTSLTHFVNEAVMTDGSKREAKTSIPPQCSRRTKMSLMVEGDGLGPAAQAQGRLSSSLGRSRPGVNLAEFVRARHCVGGPDLRPSISRRLWR